MFSNLILLYYFYLIYAVIAFINISFENNYIISSVFLSFLALFLIVNLLYILYFLYKYFYTFLYKKQKLRCYHFILFIFSLLIYILGIYIFNVIGNISWFLKQ
jgi:hypothetical protein